MGVKASEVGDWLRQHAGKRDYHSQILLGPHSDTAWLPARWEPGAEPPPGEPSRYSIELTMFSGVARASTSRTGVPPMFGGERSLWTNQASPYQAAPT